MAVGLDIGTAFLVSATKDIKNDSAPVELKSIRDAFLDVEADQSILNMLKMSNVSYVQENGIIYIVGEPALSVANLLKREARRPLSQGVISSGEHDAERMLVILLKNILSTPKVENETVFFSVPAKSIDKNMDVVYHEAIFKKIIESFGYRATAMNEAAAIAYANCSSSGFTALSTSCLTPGQKIITGRGFVNIEDIVQGDEILTKKGEWVQCTPTSREYAGKVYLIDSYGGPKFEVTEDHKIWVGREGKWDWVEAINVQEGDMLLQPWDSYSCDFLPGRKRPYICFDERVTCSNDLKKVAISLTDEVAELLGFWFGDGHLEQSNGAICFTQHEDEADNIQRISELVYSIFGKQVAIYPHGEHTKRIKFYSKALMNWLYKNGYSNNVKSIPWKVSDLNDSVLMHFLRGLISTDGDTSIEGRHIGFTSTSNNLAQFVYLGLQRLGCSPTMHTSEPREGNNLVVDHIINGQKENYYIRSSGYYSMGLINWFTNPYKMIRKTYTMGQNVTIVSSITVSDYKGKVYDVSVQGDDHSFCLPGAAIHNCGAGMVNTALVYQTMVGMAFSVSRSGDYIDQSAAKAVGSTATRLMSIKEKGVNLLDPTEGDPKQLREREAIVVYYKNLIHYVIDSIKKEFKRDNSQIELPDEIPWVISGGTAKAKNFLEFFKSEFEKERDSFPINISEIFMANDPLGDVAKGLLIAAMNE